MVSGDPERVRQVVELVSCWGSVTVVGAEPGMAQVVKLTNNILSAVALVATSEAFVAAGKAGLDLTLLTGAVNAGSGRNSMTLDKIPKSVYDRSFSYGAQIDTLMKDVELTILQGESLGVSMEVCKMAREALLRAVQAGWGRREITDFFRLMEKDAQFEFSGR
jgi:3-hydroxyisobutyrate dehydrogenase-like beta-hydroxyacid dehydrogenase